MARTKPMVNETPLDDSGSNDYRRSIRSAVHSLWDGTSDIFGFVDNMVITINRGLTRAFYDASTECGILPSELTMEERTRLAWEINSEINYVIDFGNAIIDGSKANGGKVGPLYDRAEMWCNRYEGVKSIARSMTCGDVKLKWVMNPLKEHCSSCLMLDGRVYRASIWKKYNIEPRSRDLACGGYKCGCRFIQTNDPITKGYPPRIR